MHIDDQFYKHSDDFFAANAGTGLTYDDVSLATCFSDVLPRMTRLDTTISEKISLSLPIMSADMDTVTESTMAIAMALHGGIGMIHYNMSNADQIEKVRRVKSYIHGMIDRPATVPADITVGDVLAMIEANDYNFSTFPVVDKNGVLLGLLRGGVVKSRHAAHKVADVMIPREQVLTIQEKDLGGDPIATADRIFLEHIGTNKLLVVNEKGQLRGLFTLSDIERIVASNPENVVIIDEAYVDFGGESAIPLTEKYDNLLVTGTFSKSRSMAGARLGFGIGNPSLIADLNTIKYSTNPYNVNAMTQAAGLAALEDNDYYMANCRRIVETREYTTAALRGLGFEVVDSKANFVFAKSGEISGGELYKRLRERGILVRHFNGERISEYNRITIGTREDMETLVATVGEILADKKGLLK